MKKKIAATLALILVLAGALLLAYRSYEDVNRKLALEYDTQKTMEVKPTPTPTPKPTATPTPEITETPVPENPEAPYLTLVTDTVEITAGSRFDVVAQVADITDNKDDRSWLFRYIRVEGGYDVNTPGEYNLEYFATDSDGNQSPHQSLKLIVKAQ